MCEPGAAGQNAIFMCELGAAGQNTTNAINTTKVQRNLKI